MNEQESLMWRGADTQEREMLNLLVRAIPALIQREDETGMELHKEHRSRAGLNQRLAAAELDEWAGMIVRALQKQQEEEKEKCALQPARIQGTGLPQKGEHSNNQSEQRMLESCQAEHDGEEASDSFRRDDKDDPGKAPENRIA